MRYEELYQEAIARTNEFQAKQEQAMPERLVHALTRDGWIRRSTIIWLKPNAMPESVRDRPTRSHSTIFLLSKKSRYYFDADAVREPHKHDGRMITTVQQGTGSIQHRNGERWPGEGANVRSVWSVPTEPTPFEHFATWPTKLVGQMIKAGCPEGGVVLDPFGGSGTTGLVARHHNRRAILIELNPKYCEITAKRLQQLSLFADQKGE